MDSELLNVQFICLNIDTNGVILLALSEAVKNKDNINIVYTQISSMINIVFRQHSD